MALPIDVLRKAFYQTVSTSEARSPESEPLARREAVGSGQVAAAPPIPSTYGSWTGSAEFPYQAVDSSLPIYGGFPLGPYGPGNLGGPLPASVSRAAPPGSPGYNELGYVPYNWGTNRFGNKGGALLGHPISYEVVGPTLKSPLCHWQWTVTFNGAGVGDELTLVAGPRSSALTGGSLPTVADAYHLSGLPVGELYVVVSFTGENYAGSVHAPGAACSAAAPSSSFEIFRVAGVAGQTITLEAGKKLADHFIAGGGTPTFRAITLLRPKVARLAAFPLSLNGTTQRNRVFVFLPPERSACSEYMPPYDGGGTCPGWSTGAFEGAETAGVAGEYGGAQALPVATPTASFRATVATGAPGAAGRWELEVLDGYVVTAGAVVRVRTLSGSTATPFDGVFGYFEAVSQVGTTLTLRRVPEVNSATGRPYYGGGPRASEWNPKEVVTCELYEPISSLFTSSTVNLPLVGQTRLQRLLDPRAAGSSVGGLLGATRSYTSVTPDRALWDTRPDAPDPGSLLDLGFRVVLFPARDTGGGVIGPDYDHPIDSSSSVVLDPTSDEVQSIDIDYAGGVLYLSHAPVPGAGCDVAPNGIIADSTRNPRNEVVLYAACVPYSREPSQSGGGVRVTVGFDESPYGTDDHADLYGQRTGYEPSGAPFTLNAGDPLALTETPQDVPRNGYLVLIEMDTNTGRVVSSSDPCYYEGLSGSTVARVGLQGAPYPVTGNTAVVFLKSPPTAADPDLSSDATRGSELRVQTLRFAGAEVSFGVDGSVVLNPRPVNFTLQNAYRYGRGISIDRGAVELSPETPTAGSDVFNASMRVRTNSAGGPGNLVGYDFLGTAAGVGDSYAGYIDRRQFTPSGGVTSLSASFAVDAAGNVVTATGADTFWSPTSYNKTLLAFGLDLIEIQGVTYRISGFSGVTGKAVTIADLDGGTPALALTGVQATVYRPKFFTSRGASATPSTNFNSWFLGQSQSETLLGQPIGALNLYAGSATSLSPGDGGGSTAALAFWNRYTLLGSELLLSGTYFDSHGRLNSVLNPDVMTGGAWPDYRFRGDYATRTVRELTTLTNPTFGHVVEGYAYAQARYDFLSLLPLVPGGSTYTATVFNAATGQIEVSSLLIYDLIPYGSAVFELVSVNADTTKRGLFLITAGDGVAIAPSGYFWITDLNGSLTTLTAAPLSVVNGDALTFRLHVASSLGRRVNTAYLNAALASATHSATSSLGVGLDTNAVGIVISAPVRTGIAPNEDRHAYRVTMATQPGSSVSPSNVETASLDVAGYHKAEDYLYRSPKTVTRQINPLLFQPINAIQDWAWDTVNGWWDAVGNLRPIRVPIDLPRSSDRVDAASAQTHRTQLVSVTINGHFHGAALVNAGYFRIYRTVFVGAVRTRTRLYLGPALAVQDYPLPFAGTDTVTTVTVWEDDAATLPVYIDDTATTHYYLELYSSNAAGTSCLLYGVSVTFTDPGPRNY